MNVHTNLQEMSRPEKTIIEETIVFDAHNGDDTQTARYGIQPGLHLPEVPRDANRARPTR